MLQSVFWSKLLTSSILFSKSDFRAANAVFVAKPLILGVILSISLILAL